VPILVFLGLSVLELGPDVRDRQTDVRQTSDVRQKHRLMPRLLEAGHNNSNCFALRLSVGLFICLLVTLHKSC